MGFIYKRIMLSIMLCLMTISFCWGQATVSPGDLIIVGFSTDENSFTLLATRDIAAGTSFGVTDVGWINDQAGFKSGEGNLIWKGAAIAKGELIKEVIGANYATSPNARFTLYGNFNLPASGDQFFVYRETPALWIPIYGVNYRSRNWHTMATDAATSALPSSLNLDGWPLYVSLTLRKQYRYDQVIDLDNLSQLLRDVGNFRAWRGANDAFGTAPTDYAFGKVSRLEPGDLSIIGLNDGAVDEFVAVVFKDLAAGTQLYFTDQGYMNSTLQEAMEGTITYKVPVGGLLAGQSIAYKANVVDLNFYQTDQFEFSVDGDQLLVYQQQGFIFGRNNRGSWGYDTAKPSHTSDLPAGLQSVSYQYQDVALDGNGYYVGPTTGTLTELLGHIADRSKWQFTGRQVAVVPNYPRFQLMGGVNLAWLPSANQNYVITHTNKDAANLTAAQVRAAASNPNRVNTNIQYFDGLGRPLQTVQVGASPSYQDIVTPVAYDALGREAVKYQPYTATGTNGSYRPTGIADQLAFYMGQASTSSIKQTGNPFSVTIFEPSPLNRVERQGFPGDAWQPNNVSTEHTARLAYGTNNGDVNYGTTGFAVRLFSADAVTTANHEHERILSSSGNYGAGQLYLTISKDENWQASDGKKGTVEEYKDKEGRVVLKRMFNEKAGNTEVLSTYYVYDDLGNLSFVLPPGANPDAGVPNGTLLEQFCYQYRYDGRRRLTEKKLPGKGWEHMVYNKLDQLVLSQDALQRSAGQWLFNKYDALGRNVMTGIYNSTANRQDVQAAVDAHAILWEERDNANSSGMHTGYGNQAFPIANVNYYHTISYYDDYDFHNNAFGQPNGTTQVSSARTKGLPTGTRTTVLGPGGTMLLTVNYYDDYGRIIQTKSEHHLNNGTDVVDMVYNFDGSIKNTTRTHVNGSTTTIASAYTYDHMGRKKTTSQSINGAVPTILSEMQYDEIGQLSIKKLANGLQKNEYTYNERGWLTSSSSPQFSINLKYNDGVHQQFNGNISGQIYTNNGNNVFTYQYDKLNRLTSGASLNMTELLDYDLMGNIKSLNRDGTGAKVYNYTDGNRLESITGLTASYAYDANGNATTDGRNGVTLTYNHLSLPVTASKSGLNLTYTYDANGAKLRKVANTGTTTTTDYVDGIQYTNGVIDFIQTEEGIARKSGSSYVYEYNLTDHLGNVRATFKVNGSTIEVLQRDNYYAFGMRKSALNDIGAVSLQNKYLYNGKELQEELEQYDYGARFYDPVIGRWNVVDPLAEKMRRHSPYNYVFNNPMRFIDPDGMQGLDWVMGADRNPFWDKNVTSSTDKDLNGNTYIGKTATYTTKDGYTINLFDKNKLPANDKGWDYAGREMKWETGGPTLQQAVSANLPMLKLAEGIATGAAIIASGGIGAVEAGGAYAIGIAARRADFLGRLALTEARLAGVAGEAAVGLTEAKVGVEMAGRMRFPDGISKEFLQEVKNVRYQSFTRQLRDYYQYAQDNGLRMVLHTRSLNTPGGTTLSKPLQALINNGSITHKVIPGL